MSGEQQWQFRNDFGMEHLGYIAELHVTPVSRSEKLSLVVVDAPSPLVAWVRSVSDRYGVTAGDFIWGAIEEVRLMDLDDQKRRMYDFVSASASDEEHSALEVQVTATHSEWAERKATQFDVSTASVYRACLASRRSFCEERGDAGRLPTLPEFTRRRRANAVAILGRTGANSA